MHILSVGHSLRWCYQRICEQSKQKSKLLIETTVTVLRFPDPLRFVETRPFFLLQARFFQFALKLHILQLEVVAFGFGQLEVLSESLEGFFLGKYCVIEQSIKFDVEGLIHGLELVPDVGQLLLAELDSLMCPAESIFKKDFLCSGLECEYDQRLSTLFYFS